MSTLRVSMPLALVCAVAACRPGDRPQGKPVALAEADSPAGSGTIRLEYRRPWERDVAAARLYQVSVEVR